MAESTASHFLHYKTATGVVIVPYKGDITSVQADGVVTRDDDLMEEESMVTRALINKYSDFREKRTELKKKTKFLFFTIRFSLWSIKTTILGNTSKPSKIVFHAIMKQSDENGDENWEGNMQKLFINLLREAEKMEIKALAVPLLGSGKGNAKVAARVAVKCFSEHKPKHLKKVFLVSRGKSDIYEIIVCCRRDLVLTYGNQPAGEMDVTSDKDVHLPGYERYGSIIITYNFPDGKQGNEHPNPGKGYKGTTRTAYLPDSTDGREVLALLRSAFERKLTFTIGRSETTGHDNVVKWNDIPHKTKKEGDRRYGFPDPRYLTAVREDLAKRGITEGPFVRLASESVSVHAQAIQRDLNVLQETLKKKNLVVQDNDAKGDCMFKALSQQLEHVMNKNIGHMDVRRTLVNYLRRNPTTADGTPYAEFLESQSLEDYLQGMSEDGEWGDHLMLTSAANHYLVVIVVIRPDGKETIIEPHGVHLVKRFHRLYIGHVSNRHYVSLKKDDGH